MSRAQFKAMKESGKREPNALGKKKNLMKCLKMSDENSPSPQLPCKLCNDSITEVTLTPTTNNWATDKIIKCKPHGHFLGLWMDTDVTGAQRRRNVEIDRIWTHSAVSEVDDDVLNRFFDLRELTPRQVSKYNELLLKYPN